MNRSFWLRSTLYACLLLVLSFALISSYILRELFHNPVISSTTPWYESSFVVSPGTSLRQFTQQLYQKKLVSSQRLLWLYAYYKGYANSIKAGEYRVYPGMTADELLSDVVAGNVIQYSFSIVEGWKVSEVIDALQHNPKIKASLGGLSEAEIIKKLEIPVAHLEGYFLPDTYYFTADTSDVDFLRRAYFKLQDKLQFAWETRSSDCIIKTPYEALILASIIEKESGIQNEYAEISGVFQRRLAKGLRLQADPTVIYALGDKYTGKITKNNLRFESPYNTYVKVGLPPTPIALAGMRAIDAALNPAKGNSLFFVANGQGGHVFTSSLQEHNKAVQNFRRHLEQKNNN